MLDQKTGRRIRGSYGTAEYLEDGVVRTRKATPQIITHATSDRWKKEGRKPKNRIIVSG